MNPAGVLRVERNHQLRYEAADDGYHHDPREETFAEYVDRERRKTESGDESDG